MADWLAVTFPNLYGVAGANDLTGMTNVQVAAFYLNLFSMQGPKVDADVLGLALDVYATTQSLGGDAGAAYGFQVTTYGLGAYSCNVGSSGAAFGAPNNTMLNVFQILKAVDRQAVNGILFNGNRSLDLLPCPSSTASPAPGTFKDGLEAIRKRIFVAGAGEEFFSV